MMDLMREIEILLREKKNLIRDINELIDEKEEALNRTEDEQERQFLKGYIVACKVAKEIIRRSSSSNIGLE